MPCPRGLSGAPIFSEIDKHALFAIATENIEVSTELWSEETEKSLGREETHLYHRVINYGVSLILNQHKDWIEEHLEYNEE